LISFFSEDTDFAPAAADSLKQFVSRMLATEEQPEGTINFIFCSNPYLLKLNKTYLNHHYHTDVITFDQSDSDHQISGDIYISVDQVRENADAYQESFPREIKRVMIHGVLHLLGYNDKTPEEQQEMRKKEEAYLSL